jgi:hypothetical protein
VGVALREWPFSGKRKARQSAGRESPIKLLLEQQTPKQLRIPASSVFMPLRLRSVRHRSAYRGGRSDRWVKVKNRAHPAFSRVMDQF